MKLEICGDTFFYDGRPLGTVIHAEGRVIAPADPEWPSVVLEDILDAEVIGD